MYRVFVKVDVEESIANAPLVSLQIKNTYNAKSKVRFKQLYRIVFRGAFTIDSSTLTGNFSEVTNVGTKF
jgi:hypothetical protein